MLFSFFISFIVFIFFLIYNIGWLYLLGNSFLYTLFSFCRIALLGQFGRQYIRLLDLFISILPVGFVSSYFSIFVFSYFHIFVFSYFFYFSIFLYLRTNTNMNQQSSLVNQLYKLYPSTLPFTSKPNLPNQTPNTNTNNLYK